MMIPNELRVQFRLDHSDEPLKKFEIAFEIRKIAYQEIYGDERNIGLRQPSLQNTPPSGGAYLVQHMLRK